MKAKGVRLHAANDLRLEEFELPEITDDEILVKVVSDSICMSTYKCAILGTEHKRVHEDVAEHPAIMGHEFAGDIVKVGKNHQDQFKPGMKFTLQPALNYKGTMWSPGYSYEFFGGDATYCIIPAEVMANCLDACLSTKAVLIMKLLWLSRCHAVSETFSCSLSYTDGCSTQMMVSKRMVNLPSWQVQAQWDWVL